MSEVTPHFPPIVVLLFLGTVLLLGLSFLVLLYGAVCRSRLLAAIGAGAAIIMVTGYSLLLFGSSLLSSEKTLPAGGWKYFCEIDCHLAYSIAGAQTAAALGPEMQQTAAQGKFVIVRVRTWFDPSTISSHRGDSPLTPNARRVVLVDAAGRYYHTAKDSAAALARLGGSSTPLTQPLRPGESYTTDFVFHIPAGAHGLRLLITEDDPETRLVIGHENSLLHKEDLPRPLFRASAHGHTDAVGAKPLTINKRRASTGFSAPCAAPGPSQMPCAILASPFP